MERSSTRSDRDAALATRSPASVRVDGAIVVDTHGLAWQRDDTREPLVALPPRW